VAGFRPTVARADEPADADNDTRHNTEEPKAAEQPPPVLTPAPVVAAPIAPPAGPKFGDLSVTGYFRGGFGASSQKGRMVCFSLANPAGLVSKYRLGNECEVWSETHFTIVTYVGDDGAVAHMHVMPTVYIPIKDIGYSPAGAVNSPAVFSTSTGAVLYFPNLYADITDIPWLYGGTAWAGTRYYKRESIYISDFFYWNPSGVGAGVEDVTLGKIWPAAPDAVKALTISYGAFAVDGEPGSPTDMTSPPLPNQVDFGVRNDLQIRGIRPWASGEFQLGGQLILNFSNNPATHNGWGVTLQFVQKLLGGDLKLAGQYGRGGGTGFGTLARYYYPDFSVRHDLSETRIRGVGVLTMQPIEWFGSQLAGVYQRDENFLGNPGFTTVWWSGGGRVGVAPLRHLKVLGEAGYDRVTKSNGSRPQFLAKITGAVAIAADRGFWSRPELRAFATYARWNEEARIAGVDSGNIYRDVYTDFLSGWTFGLQAETWW
jgi:maltoporin